MNNRELENKLRTAVSHAAPEFPEHLLSADDIQKGTVMEMPTKMNRKKIWIPIASAAAVLLMIGSFFGYSTYSYNKVDSVIGLDVNPSIELNINRKEKVLNARAVNDDAKKILDGMDLKGTDLNVAMNALVGSMLKNGYIDELANSILISVENNDTAKSAALQKQLTDEIEKLLGEKQIDGAVICQDVEDDDKLQKLADANGISLGKAKLVSQLVSQNPQMKFEDAAKLSINQLNLLAEQKGTQLKDATTVGQASDKAYIGTEKALQLALERAGVKAADTSAQKVEMDWDDGRMVYEVEFYSQGVEYDVEIDALEGTALKFEKDRKDDNASGSTGNTSQGSQNSGSGSVIGEQKAKDAALKHAGVPASSVTWRKVDYDRDDNEYEVEFTAGNTEYEYKINARTGAVLQYEKETKASGRPASSAPQSDSSRPAATASSGASAKRISADEAKQIALSHAGVAAGNARKLRVELDRDDGVELYEVEFDVGNTEYSYEIKADNGNILSYDIDQDD